jgi:polyhydroxyalkanoate synthase
VEDSSFKLRFGQIERQESPGDPRMSETEAPDARNADLADPLEFSRSMAEIAEKSRKLVSDWIERQAAYNGATSIDPLNIGDAFLEMTARMMQDPVTMVQAQMSLWYDYMRLWQSATERMMGGEPVPVAEPEQHDRRFTDPAWEENQLFDFVKQSYLLTARWLQATVEGIEGLDDKTAKKVDFYTRQFVDAMAPSNFLMTNPEVGGENLVKGLQNLLDDLDRGQGRLDIKMTDYEAFEVGVNIALTPGKVVYQNELIQLLQYAPATDKVYKRPLLIIPPWINKFYILDLREKNSFIKWAVDRGHTVFVISWVNPDEELAGAGFDDYMTQGPLAALDAMEKATGEREANVIGYCLGGTLLACTLGYLAAKEDDRIKSATFLATMIDFDEAGELEVFIDEEQLTALEERMSERGYLDGSAMATTFNMLRANDLIWSFVLRGEQLPARQGSLPLRPALLERRFHAHAGRHAQLLPAQHVPGQQADRTGRPRRHRTPGRADRLEPGQDAGLFPLDPRGSHRALDLDLRGHAVVLRAHTLRVDRLRPYRRRRQPAGCRQVFPLDQRQRAHDPLRLAQAGRGSARLLVARLGQVGGPQGRAQGRGENSRRRQAESPRGRARLLREGVDPGVRARAPSSTMLG